MSEAQKQHDLLLEQLAEALCDYVLNEPRDSVWYHRYMALAWYGSR